MADVSLFDHDFKNYPELTNTQLETLRFVSPHPQIEEDFYAVVEKVHDGDTYSMRHPRRDFLFPVRLLDIDTRELKESGGKEARDYAASRVLGREVYVMIDPKDRVDKYGRLLGRVYVDGMNIGDELMNLGLAVPFGKKHEGEPLPVEKTFALKQWGLS